MSKQRGQGKSLLLALLCFVAGWLFHRPEAVPPPVCPPAEPVACGEPKPTPLQKRRVALKPPMPPKAAEVPAESARLRECFSGTAYRGSAFALKLRTDVRGDVTQVGLVGDDFMSQDQRGCVKRLVEEWQLGENVPPDLVVRVVL